MEVALTRYAKEIAAFLAGPPGLPPPILAVVPGAVEDIWRREEWPPWLALLHHGALVGLDAHGAVRAAFVISRQLPPAWDRERTAGALTGMSVEKQGYETVRRLIATVDGKAVEVETRQHPDPLCEALRRQVTVAGLVQAVGRGRGARRTAANPLDVHLWTDTPVPELGPVTPELWQGPSVDFQMLAAGVWVDGHAEAHRLHPELWGSPDAVRKAREREDEQADFCLEETLLKQMSGCFFKVARTAKSPARALFLARLPPAERRRRLEEALGPLTFFEATMTVPVDPPQHYRITTTGVLLTLVPAPVKFSLTCVPPPFRGRLRGPNGRPAQRRART